MQDYAKLRVDLRPSRQLATVLVVVHLLGIISAWSSLSGLALYLTAAGIAVSGIACVSNVLWRAAGTPACLELYSSGRAAWCDRQGQWHDGLLGVDHFVSNRVVIVCLHQSMLRRKWVVVLPDAVPGDQFRRLRVRLRWHRELAQPKAEESARTDR